MLEKDLLVTSLILQLLNLGTNVTLIANSLLKLAIPVP